MNYKQALNKKAAIAYRSLAQVLNAAAKSRPRQLFYLQRSLKYPKLTDFGTKTSIGTLKQLAKRIDNQVDVSSFRKFIDPVQDKHIASLTQLNDYRITLINDLLKNVNLNLTGLFNSRGLIGGLLKSKNVHRLLPLKQPTQSFDHLIDVDMHPIVHSLLSAKFGRLAMLPRAKIDRSRVPSLYFGFLDDPEFNGALWDKIRFKPNAMRLNQLYRPISQGGIGRVFNTRGHSMQGSQYSIKTRQSDDYAARNYGQKIIRLGDQDITSIQNFIQPIQLLTSKAGRGYLYLPQQIATKNRNNVPFVKDITNFGD